MSAFYTTGKDLKGNKYDHISSLKEAKTMPFYSESEQRKKGNQKS